MTKSIFSSERKPYLAIVAGLTAALVILLIAFIISNNTHRNIENSVLPLPEISDGIRGTQFGIDKNINEDTVDSYLNRDDTVYRDMRMLYDPANYEAIGGDSYLSGLVEGFEVVPYPYLVNVSGLPEDVGDTYTGKTLFTETSPGTYIPNYVESLDILTDIFPQDKNIFLMCGGGGYAGMTKNMLISLGWDPNKIYNVGGYWNYRGDHNITIKREASGDKEAQYAFWKIPYHNIDFTALHEVLNEKNT